MCCKGRWRRRQYSSKQFSQPAPVAAIQHTRRLACLDSLDTGSSFPKAVNHYSLVDTAPMHSNLFQRTVDVCSKKRSMTTSGCQSSILTIRLLTYLAVPMG